MDVIWLEYPMESHLLTRFCSFRTTSWWVSHWQWKLSIDRQNWWLLNGPNNHFWRINAIIYIWPEYIPAWAGNVYCTWWWCNASSWSRQNGKMGGVIPLFNALWRAFEGRIYSKVVIKDRGHVKEWSRKYAWYFWRIHKNQKRRVILLKPPGYTI